jgi:cleavage and polyadenylation specificity factor subunit 2
MSFCSEIWLFRHAPSIDLVLLSHGDLAHCGLYPYAHARWGLKAQTYTTLPVQAMGRIAASEDIEGFRDEQDAGDQVVEDSEEHTEDGITETPVAPKDQVDKKGKYVATLQEVHDAFDSVNTLRYSQPTHLQGNARATPDPL